MINICCQLYLAHFRWNGKAPTLMTSEGFKYDKNVGMKCQGIMQLKFEAPGSTQKCLPLTKES